MSDDSSLFPNAPLKDLRVDTDPTGVQRRTLEFLQQHVDATIEMDLTTGLPVSAVYSYASNGGLREYPAVYWFAP